MQVRANEPSVVRAKQRGRIPPIPGEAVAKYTMILQKDGALVSAWRSRPAARWAQRLQVPNQDFLSRSQHPRILRILR
jgi:hypothetical protein